MYTGGCTDLFGVRNSISITFCSRVNDVYIREVGIELFYTLNKILKGGNRIFHPHVCVNYNLSPSQNIRIWMLLYLEIYPMG